ncbi:alpha-1B adrenergic receptor-like [Acanthaster planci]|uniref:Alpha-1B adrenergic receptor-like n=1 Tax=Acanthaster planci TaxID=133434 RepID=A0A8B7ZD76_ACAPL|nr:alpha-1B adrenergic receptor-like [Acanthaster planci]
MDFAERTSVVLVLSSGTINSAKVVELVTKVTVMFGMTTQMTSETMSENVTSMITLLSSPFMTPEAVHATGVSVASDMTSSTVMETTTQGDGRNFRFEDPVQRIIVGCIYSLVAVVGFSGNFMVILAVILSRKLQTRTNVFVVNLAVADLLTCGSIPFTAVALFSLSGWPKALPPLLCSFMGGLYFLSIAASIMNLVAIAINRYVLITKPLKTYRTVYTPKKIIIMLFFTWAYPCLGCSLTFFGIGMFGYSEKYKTCNQDNSLETSDLLSLIASVLAYPIQLIILVVCYVKIYRHITGHLKKMGKNVEMSERSGSSPTSSTTQLQKNTSPSFSKRQVEITKNLFYVVCAFIACLAPFAIALMIPPSDPAIPWTGTLVIFNSAVNPIIYGAKHPHFKEVFRHMLRCRYHMIPEPSGCLRKIRSR